MSISAHVFQRYLRATADQVWAAITDSTWTNRYFHEMGCVEPLADGHPFRAVLPDGSPAVEGDVEVFDPPRRLVQTWRVLSEPGPAAEPPGRVEWQVEQVGRNLTRLRLVHGDLAFSPLTWALVKDDWNWVLDSMKTLLETGEPLPEIEGARPATADPADGDWHRAQAIEANNSAWELIELSSVEIDADRAEELLRRAYTAAYHWDKAAGRRPENAARAAYMIAKSLLIAGRPEAAMEAADRTLALCLQHNLADFDLAYAHEARARALIALGRPGEGDEAWATARAVPIADDEDREILLRDFSS